MLGCHVHEQGVRFEVWAPRVRRLDVVFTNPDLPRLPLSRGEGGYFVGEAPRSVVQQDYWLELDGERRRADPCSRFQPSGLNGPSRVVDLRRDWRDREWRGLALRDYVLYELHVGCFSPTHDLLGVQRRLDRLAELGVTAIELMPLAQCPGSRNWGYDGALLYAVQHSLGGPHALQDLVEACHARGMAVLLDVVYNHLGPEGNYLAEFGPYFTDRYHTPWGQALNFDGPDSDEVRRFFVENAVQWIRDFHFDGLRLDAIQTIFDQSARPFLAELAEAVHQAGREQGRTAVVIGETNQNDARQITDPAHGGLGLDAVWSDDFHHALHARLTGERVSVYQDYGSSRDVAGAVAEGFLYQGQYSRRFRRRHGSSARGLPPERLIVFAQNHDQVGNRLYGDRLSCLVSPAQLKFAAALLLLSPQTPMLFMGEEYGETRPFQYFIDHQNPQLRRQVRMGRVRDCGEFLQPGRKAPDPSSLGTFAASILDHHQALQGEGRRLWELHRRLIAARRILYRESQGRPPEVLVHWNEESNLLVLQRRAGERWLAAFLVSDQPAIVANPLLAEGGRWRGELFHDEASSPAAEAPQWELEPWSFAVWKGDGSDA